ncbi:DUF2071 domain-containing protein [Nonomuraea sp. NPDC052116]|uniref:YqjF family protein n=1 Tax=Nonomuraea sp. NPDC052116 TaxID=3155665 RepID=UPI00342752B1
MYHRWSEITFIHWRYPPACVRALVPGGLTVETFDGAAWIGLTPFLMRGVRFGLPYFWSDMSVDTRDGRTRYRCRRRRPGPAGARCDAEAERGAPLAERERDELAHFLTARYRLFTFVAGRPATAQVEHPPWPLYRSRLIGLDQDLIQAAGLPICEKPPVLHASPGVPVRVGMWTW